MTERPVAAESADGARSFLTFRLDQRLYALPAGEVTEVIRTPSVARVPQAPKALIGIANLRGTVLPLASLRALIGLDDAAVADGRAIVLDGAAPTALAVDSIEALVSVLPSRIENESTGLSAESGEQLAGAFQTAGGRVAKILNVRALLDRAFAERARPARATISSSQPTAAARAPAAGSATDVLVTFEVEGQEYALPLSVVEEIVAAPGLVTRLPHGEALVIGVMPFHDRLLPLLSLRGLLGLPPRSEPDGREKVVVASVGNAVVGLVADRACAILAADRRSIDPIPPVLAARSGGETRIKAIYRCDGGRRLISILAPEQMFREDIMDRLGAGGDTAGPAAPASPIVERQFLVFRLGADEFGLPIDAVDEVAAVPEQITRVPKTPKFLEGVVNLRGEVLPVVDQRRRFEMPPAENPAARRMVVVRSARHRAGLIVDGIAGVLRTASDAIEPSPGLTSEVTSLVQGVINLPGESRIVLILDPAELLTRAERELLDAMGRKAKTAS